VVTSDPVRTPVYSRRPGKSAEEEPRARAGDLDPGGGHGTTTESSTDHGEPSIRITLARNDDGWWTAHDETNGLTAQGETRDEALSNLDDVIDAVENDAGPPPTDEELREAGIDPETDRQAGSGERPDALE